MEPTLITWDHHDVDAILQAAESASMEPTLITWDHTAEDSRVPADHAASMEPTLITWDHDCRVRSLRAAIRWLQWSPR